MYVLLAIGLILLLFWRFGVHTTWPDYFHPSVSDDGSRVRYLATPRLPAVWKPLVLESHDPDLCGHVAILGALLAITLQLSPLGLNLPTRMVYGLVGGTTLLEGWLCLRLIDWLRPKEE